jgi:nucleoside 2-deoxyribosyltransferase
MTTVSIYLAAKYGRREEMEEIAIRLMNEYGYDITARWVFGGEEGKTNEEISIFDLEDVAAADTVVNFTEYPDTYTTGGRHVEYGYAIATGKRLVVIGPRENVFHHYPTVEQFDTLSDWLQSEIGIKLVSA